MTDESAEFERQRARAVEIGERHQTVCWGELVTFLSSPAPRVRRAAASAMGKLIDCSSDLHRLFWIPLSSRLASERADQVRQYMLKTLAKCAPSLTESVLGVLRDIARNPAEKGYVREAANEAVAAGEAALRQSEAVHRHWCTRCRKPITREESARAIARWGKPYCYHCADERELDARCFERTVEGAKNLRTKDLVAVQSKGEKRIGDWLEVHQIAYVYDERYRIAADVALRPDFYLPEFDLYIEYWGMDTQDYLARKAEKRLLYQRAGKKLISLDYREFSRIEEILAEKLARYINLPPVTGTPPATRPPSL